MHWRERGGGGEGDSRIFDTESGVCAYFMTENWSQVGESRIDELGNEGENSRVVKLVMVIHHLAMHLPKEQAHHHHNHHNGHPQMLWVPPTPRHVVEWCWNKNEQKGGLGLSFCFGEWRRQSVFGRHGNERRRSCSTSSKLWDPPRGASVFVTARSNEVTCNWFDYININNNNNNTTVTTPVILLSKKETYSVNLASSFGQHIVSIQTWKEKNFIPLNRTYHKCSENFIWVVFLIVVLGRVSQKFYASLKFKIFFFFFFHFP